MSDHTLSLTDDLYRYLREVSLREPELLHRLRTETQRLEMARMQISPEQGQFMRLIAMLIGARRIAEDDRMAGAARGAGRIDIGLARDIFRWEEHTSEIQSLMRISYAV